MLEEEKKEEEEEMSYEEYLIQCGRYGDLEDLEECIRMRIDLNTRDEHQNTALHMAAGNGHLQAVNALIVGGAMLNPQNESGNTPLHWAALNGHLVIVDALLNAKADPNLKNEFGSLPFDEAMQSKNKPIMDMLMKVTNFEGTEEDNFGGGEEEEKIQPEEELKEIPKLGEKRPRSKSDTKKGEPNIGEEELKKLEENLKLKLGFTQEEEVKISHIPAHHSPDKNT